MSGLLPLPVALRRGSVGRGGGGSDTSSTHSTHPDHAPQHAKGTRDGAGKRWQHRPRAPLPCAGPADAGTTGNAPGGRQREGRSVPLPLVYRGGGAEGGEALWLGNPGLGLLGSPA